MPTAVFEVHVDDTVPSAVTLDEIRHALMALRGVALVAEYHGLVSGPCPDCGAWVKLMREGTK